MHLFSTTPCITFNEDSTGPVESSHQHFSLKKLWNVNTLSLGLNWRLGRSNVGLKISGSIRLNSKNWSHSTSIENIHRLRGFAGKFWNRLHLVSWQIYHQWHYVGSHSFSRTKVFRTEFAKLRLEGLAPKISAKYLRKKRRDEFEANLFLKNKDWLISKKKRFWKKRKRSCSRPLWPRCWALWYFHQC